MSITEMESTIRALRADVEALSEANKRLRAEVSQAETALRFSSTEYVHFWLDLAKGVGRREAEDEIAALKAQIDAQKGSAE